MQKSKTKYDRIYVCHTFYNVYVTLLKECNRPKEEQGRADIALSKMSTDFGNLKEQLEACGMFRKVHILDERKASDFPELAKYQKSHNNVVWHMVNRIILTKKHPQKMEPYITIDFKQYRDIYVYCDWDPIGWYLSYKHIYYHAMEDGLDCLKYLDGARYENRGHFGLKAFLAKRNIIFIQNGYGKYCLDMEVNDRSVLKYDYEKYVEVPRKPLELALSDSQRKMILKVFMPDAGQFMEELGNKAKDGNCMLFLSQPHPRSLEARIQICKDIIRDYAKGCHVVIKPHPRDTVDYETLFPECTVIKGKFPIEVLNFIEGTHFKLAISIVTTALDTIDFADEKINLGQSFWDAYEDPELHNYNAAI